jgi:Reverse transcriptase (RNA-dependent DNA polymerase)
MRGIVDGDQTHVIVTNVTDEDITVGKNVCIRTMESLDDSHQPTLWPQATEDLAVYFGMAPVTSDVWDILKELSKKVLDRTAELMRNFKEKMTPGQPKGAAAVNINTTDDITPEQVKELRQVLEKHAKLFSDTLGLAKEPESDWLRIPLLPGAEKEIKPQRQYRLGPKERQVVDEVFDEQKRQGRLIDSGPSPAGWPVFVVKKGAKWRPVVDLRGLNKFIAPDAYPLPRQDDITSAIMGKYWLSIFDILSAYYQRRVHPSDGWKLATSTHRGHEAWTVAPMGLSISVAHQQRYMDKLLAKFRWRIACCFYRRYNCLFGHLCAAPD